MRRWWWRFEDFVERLVGVTITVLAFLLVSSVLGAVAFGLVMAFGYFFEGLDGMRLLIENLRGKQ